MFAPFRSWFHGLILPMILPALLVPPTATAAPTPPVPPKDIDLVLCLDVSGSMDGLIESAKLRLWDIVNELAKVKPVPNLRVGLYSYGHNTYDAQSGWVRKELSLTTDLDDVYARLNALTTNGGVELVARVCRDALRDQPWSRQANALKIIFVCGNEEVDQDKQVKLGDVAEQARKAGIIINTIYCGPDNDTIAAGWRTFALQCNGSYANIDQDRARTQQVIATPFDKPLLELNEKLNRTYVAYGVAGREKLQLQKAQDAAAEKATAAGAAPAAALARVESKANSLYRNSTWDLVDRLKEDKTFDLSKLKPEELPEELRQLKPQERLEFLKAKAGEREKLQAEINQISAQRAKFIDEARKKMPKSESEKTLDEALKAIIRKQASAVGFEVPAASQP
jgi:hypothetical protein